MEPLLKRILIISGTVPPEESATAILIKKLLPYFQNQGCQIDMLTVKSSFSNQPVEKYDALTIYRADSLLFTPKKRKCLRDILYAIHKRLICRKKQDAIGIYKKTTVCALERELEKLPMDRYDAVIAVCAYYDAAEALLRYMEKHPLRAKTALYQVDPLAENRIYIQNNDAQLQQYEKNLYEKLDWVFTTPIIYSTKKKMGWNMSSVTALEFPMSVKEIAAQPQKNNQIRCVYAGFLYGTIRDAAYTLDLFSKLEDNVHLYVVGKGQEDLLRSYENGLLKDRIHILGEKSAAECDQILADADVLVNIGNRVNNQVPSKLLHYISFGKPILNVTACEDCPTLPYMQKYPLALSVQDTKTTDEETTQAVQFWLQENCRRTVEPKEILHIFEDCTSAYIAKTIIAKL